MTKIFVLALILILSLSSVSFAAESISDLKAENDTRVFAKDAAIQVKLAKFHNRYGIDLVGHLYILMRLKNTRRWQCQDRSAQ